MKYSTASIDQQINNNVSSTHEHGISSVRCFDFLQKHFAILRETFYYIFYIMFNQWHSVFNVILNDVTFVNYIVKVFNAVI